MSKYKVGDELIIVTDPNEETEKLNELTRLKIDGDFAQISWGLKIVDVTFDKPYVRLLIEMQMVILIKFLLNAEI